MTFLLVILLGLQLLGSAWAQDKETPVPAKKLEIEIEAPAPPWRRLWAEARDYVRRGDLLAAAEAYKELLSLRGGLDQARWEYAQVLERLGQSEEAVRELGLYLEKTPQNYKARSLLASLLLKKKLYPQAEHQYREILSVHPQDPEAKRGLALALYGQGRFEEALPFLRDSLGFFSNDLELKRALALTLVSLQKTSQAVVYLRDIYLAGERDRLVLKNYAQSLIAMDRLEEAMPILRQLTASFPEEAWAHLALAKILLQKGRNSAAQKELKSYLYRVPKDVEALKLLGRICLEAGDLSRALRLFSRAVSFAPRDTEALDMLATISEKRQLYQSALRYLQRAQAIAKDRQRSLRLVQILIKLRRYPEALALLGDLNDQETLRLKRKIYRLTGRYDLFLKTRPPAREALEVLTFLAPFRPDLKDQLWAELPRMLKEVDEAWIGEHLEALLRLGLGAQLLELDLPAVKRIQVLLDQRRINKALLILNKSKDDDLLLLRAEVLARLGCRSKAFKALYALPRLYWFEERRMRLEPLALIYSGDLHEALYLILKRLATFPEDGYYYGLLQVAFYRFGLKPEAEALTSLAGSIPPPLKTNKGFCLTPAWAQTKPKILKKILEDDPVNAEALWLLANIKEQEGNKRAAVALLSRVVDLFPRHYEARLRLYRLYRDLGQEPSAILILKTTDFSPLCRFEPCQRSLLIASSKWEERFKALSQGL
ncbi:tetratricopeptide repeat protein [Thermosulfuriphilus sp.]